MPQIDPGISLCVHLNVPLFFMQTLHFLQAKQEPFLSLYSCHTFGISSCIPESCPKTWSHRAEAQWHFLTRFYSEL